MWRVDAAGVDIADGHRDVGELEGREDADGGEVDCAACGGDDGVVDEGVGQIGDVWGAWD